MGFSSRPIHELCILTIILSILVQIPMCFKICKYAEIPLLRDLVVGLHMDCVS